MLQRPVELATYLGHPPRRETVCPTGLDYMHIMHI
jgi:hypothetical protein